MGVRRRHIVSKPVRRYLRPARARSRQGITMGKRKVARLEPESRQRWALLEPGDVLAVRAVRIAREMFGPVGVDAALGWLFSRFPELGQQGDDMVDHHAGLSDDGYYWLWVRFCQRLGVVL